MTSPDPKACVGEESDSHVAALTAKFFSRSELFARSKPKPRPHPCPDSQSKAQSSKGKEREVDLDEEEERGDLPSAGSNSDDPDFKPSDHHDSNDDNAPFVFDEDEGDLKPKGGSDKAKSTDQKIQHATTSRPTKKGKAKATDLHWEKFAQADSDYAADCLDDHFQPGGGFSDDECSYSGSLYAAAPNNQKVRGSGDLSVGFVTKWAHDMRCTGELPAACASPHISQNPP